MKRIVLAALAAALFLMLAACGAAPIETTAPETVEATTAPPRYFYGGVEVNGETAEVTLDPSGSLVPLTTLAEHLPGLRTIHFGDREPVPEELTLLQSVFPQAALDYCVTLAGEKFPCTATELDLSHLMRSEVNEAVEKLEMLPSVQRVELPPQSEDPESLTLEDVGKFQRAYPEVLFDYRFSIWGKAVSTLDEALDLSHIEMDDGGAAVRAALPYMTCCKSLDMDSCGVSNEDMAAIRDDFPDIKVVWRIWFGTCYTCRTDVEKILASKSYGNITSENGAALKYCTEVRYLDLGHNPNLNDISFVQYMPKLEVAILAINGWSDATPLASCPQLEYLEIFNTKCDDVTPLLGLKNLRHLNISGSKVSDASPLYQMTWLERLWIGMYTRIPRSELKDIQAALPNCEVNITNNEPTGEGWRENERYDLLKEQFGYTEADFALY